MVVPSRDTSNGAGRRATGVAAVDAVVGLIHAGQRVIAESSVTSTGPLTQSVRCVVAGHRRRVVDAHESRCWRCFGVAHHVDRVVLDRGGAFARYLERALA